MTDFLSRMTARALGHMPTAQPVIAPLYGRRAAFVEQQPDPVPFDGDRYLSFEQDALPYGSPSASVPVSHTGFSAQNPGMRPEEEGLHVYRDVPDAPNVPLNVSASALAGEVVDAYQEDEHPQKANAPKGEPASVYPITSSLSEEAQPFNGSDAYQAAPSLQKEARVIDAIDERARPASRIVRGEARVVDGAKDAYRGTNERYQGLREASRLRVPGALAQDGTSLNVPGAFDLDSASLNISGVLVQDSASFNQMRRGRSVQQAVERNNREQRTLSGRNVQPEEMPQREEQAPTIQVTIGRIEVRATVPPPTRVSAQRPGPTVMGLDDYVNQRNKGGRS